MLPPDARTLVPLGRVLGPVAVAVAAEIAAWAIFLAHPAADPGWYGRPRLLAAVHALTVGTIAAAIAGVAWQLVPVVRARAWNPRAAGVVNGAFAVAVPLLIWGMAVPSARIAGAVGVTLALAALGARSALAIMALARAEGRGAQRAWLLAAEGCLLGGLALAALLWAGRAGHPVLVDPIAGIRLHASLLLGGWVGGWIVGAGSILVPMFAVAPEPSPRWLALAGVAWFAGVLTGAPWLWALGALMAAGALGDALRRGLRVGVPLAQVAAGLAGLAAFAGLLAVEAVPVDVAVVALLVLFVLPVLRGVAQRIVPFLAWTDAFGARPAGAPTIAEIFPASLARLQLALSLAGGAGLVAARWQAAPLAEVAGWLLLGGAVAQAAVLGVAMLRIGRRRRGGAAIAGMEAR